MRLACKTDTDTLIRWIHDMSVDIGESSTPNQVQAHETPQLLSDQRLHVWEDGGLCSMYAWSAPTSHRVRIIMVYTPPGLRHRGYASARVAALSKRMLDSGKTFCCLFTDLSSPIPNSIHQRIGYRSVCDFTEYRLEQEYEPKDGNHHFNTSKGHFSGKIAFGTLGDFVFLLVVTLDSESLFYHAEKTK